MKFKNKEKKETSLENIFVSQVIDNEAAVVVLFARVGTITTGEKLLMEVSDCALSSKTRLQVIIQIS